MRSIPLNRSLKTAALHKRSNSTAIHSDFLPQESSILDLDFVPQLLDRKNVESGVESGGRGKVDYGKLKVKEVNVSSSSNGREKEVNRSISEKFSKLKFQVLDPMEVSRNNLLNNIRASGMNSMATSEVMEKTVNEAMTNTTKVKSTFSFDSLINSNSRDIESSTNNTTTTTSLFSKLQSLADSVPERIYWNPLADVSLGAATMNYEPEADVSYVLPTMMKADVDWSRMSITSVLKKIVSEEVLVELEGGLEAKGSVEDVTSITTETTSILEKESLIVFNPMQLRLLGKQNLQQLCKLFGIEGVESEASLKKLEKLLIAFYTENSSKYQFTSGTEMIPCDQVKKLMESTQPLKKTKEDQLTPIAIEWNFAQESLLQSLFTELDGIKSESIKKLKKWLDTINSSHPNLNITPLPARPKTSLKSVKENGDFWQVVGEEFTRRWNQSQEGKVKKVKAVTGTACKTKWVTLQRSKTKLV